MLVDGVMGQIRVGRDEDGGDLECYACLQGFRGTAEFSVTVFRFGRGNPEEKSDRFSWTEDASRGWNPFLTHERLVSEGWLTEDHKIRLLLTLHLRVDEDYMARIQTTLNANSLVTRHWSSPPCAFSRAPLAEQLRQRKVVEGERWTTHNIAHEFQSPDFVNRNKTFNFASPFIPLGAGANGRIVVGRDEAGNDFRCYLHLTGFRSTLECIFTVFRFGRGCVEQVVGDRRRLNVDTMWGPRYFLFLTHERLVSEGWLTEDHKIRLLLTLHLKQE